MICLDGMRVWGGNLIAIKDIRESDSEARPKANTPGFSAGNGIRKCGRGERHD